MRAQGKAGAIFSLDKAARVDVSERLANDWVGIVQKGSDKVTVSSACAIDNYADSLEESYFAAQEALDFFAVRGLANLASIDVDKSHVTWWTESDLGLVLRVHELANIGEPILSAEGYVQYADGTIPPRPLPAIVPWQPSFRYYRLSQTTGDLFDSFRNLYLAFESLLSSVAPPLVNNDGRHEAEGTWLRRALGELDKMVGLGKYWQAMTDPVLEIYESLYVGTRIQLFHSKSRRPVLLPHSGDDRQAVTESLKRLGRLYLGLARDLWSVSRRSSSVSTSVFHNAYDFPGEMRVYKADVEQQEADPSRLQEAGGVRLNTRKAIELESDRIRYWLAEGDARKISTEVPSIDRIAFSRGSELFATIELDEAIELDGVDWLQCQFGLRLVNTLQPRSHFAT